MSRDIINKINTRAPFPVDTIVTFPSSDCQVYLRRKITKGEYLLQKDYYCVDESV